MCNRYTITGHGLSAKKQRAYLRQRFGTDQPHPDELGQADWDELDELSRGRYNVAPSQPILVVERSEQGRRLAVRKWGVQRSGRPWMNARDDALLKRWSGLMAPDRRILIPADGWYEWTKPEKPKAPKQPWRFTVDGGELFAFAAVATAGEAAIVTTRPSPTAATIHNRMPAVLPGEEVIAAWLDPDVSPEEAATLIEPLDDHRIGIKPVSTLVNSWQNDGPELLEEAARSEAFPGLGPGQTDF